MNRDERIQLYERLFSLAGPTEKDYPLIAATVATAGLLSFMLNNKDPISSVAG